MPNGYLNATQFALARGKSHSRIRRLLGEDRIEGARKNGWEWEIPENARILPPPTRELKSPAMGKIERLERIRRFAKELASDPMLEVELAPGPEWVVLMNLQKELDGYEADARKRQEAETRRRRSGDPMRRSG